MAGETDFNEMYLWETDIEQMCLELLHNTLNSILLFALLQLPVFWCPGAYKSGKERKSNVYVYVCAWRVGALPICPTLHHPHYLPSKLEAFVDLTS